MVQKEDDATTAKDAVLPMKHVKTCALLGGGETWTQKGLGVLIQGSTCQFVQRTVRLALFSKWPLCFDMRDGTYKQIRQKVLDCRIVQIRWDRAVIG